MKIRYLIISLSLFPIISYSQPQFAVGGKIGVNISNVSSNLNTQEASKTGLHFGAVGTMSVGNKENMYLVGELLFNQKGGKNLVSGQNSISTLDLIVLARYVFSPKKDFPLKIFLNAGPYTGAMLSRKVDSIPERKINKGAQQIGIFGLALGGGLMYPLGNGNIFIEGRYAFDLTSIVPASLERSSATSISIGYIYNLKGKSQEEKDKAVESGFE